MSWFNSKVMYKTFKDLKFAPHPVMPGIKATLDFPNGYKVSVVQGRYFYSTRDTYEVACLTNSKVVYPEDTTFGLCGDVVGYCSPDKVTELMEEIQKLPPII